MNILIIPDVHGRTFWKDAVDKHLEECDKVIFLGDYLDEYPEENITRKQSKENFKEIINPKEKPEWLINLTNDGWYGISSGPYQHLVSTQLRAVEEGLTIVRSTGSGISAVINRYGKIIDYLGLNQEGLVDVSLPEKLTVPTIYNSFGNIIPLLLCLVNILISFFLISPHHLSAK
jgi:hypothetical protein